MNGRLNERAMLADLSIGSWEGRRKDKKVADETIRAARAASDAGAWWTRTLPPRMFKKIQAAIDRGRQIQNEYTLPWNDSGTRILPAKMFMEYTKAMREARAKFEEAVDEFLREYPTAVADAKNRLGKLYHPDHFPSVAAVRAKFYWQTNFMPLPDASDFRVDLGTDETNRIRDEIEGEVKKRMNDAAQDLWVRLYDVVSKVAERLSDPDKIFRDSMIRHVVELCDLLPKLNVTGNGDLERLRQEVMKKIATAKPDDLRVDKTQRKQTADAATAIMEQMKAFMPKE